MNTREDLTERQMREIGYHSGRATLVRQLRRNGPYEVLKNPGSRWWNHNWALYSMLMNTEVQGKSALVPGCGEGLDAIRLSKLGAEVCAFDLSPDMLRVAGERAEQEGAVIDFRQMPCERLSYVDESFDLIFIHDVLHHCDLTRCLSELVRVAKPGGRVLINELYTHSVLQNIRESRFGCWLQPKLVPLIYGNANQDTYTTEDERKLNESDLFAITRNLCDARCSYFNMMVGRVVPGWEVASKLDRIALKIIGRASYLFAGRFILSGIISK